MGTKKAFAKITANQNLRTCDSHGCGSFGASRGNRKHNGIDIITVPGEKIMSPISGTVTRYPYPYGNDLSYTGIEIVNSEYKIKMFYLKPIAPMGSTVFAGKYIATIRPVINEIEIPANNKLLFKNLPVELPSGEILGSIMELTSFDINKLSIEAFIDVAGSEYSIKG
ncbi:predicted protein [Nematostella vectensis]|uniref:Uncharacterized protein n=1 Tax=Nematostella vectensis TaxID=45351 RepID=A7T421_NEMVE|nr:predicted protein [Nematostella vectensis]|eukprot:XP_001621392.1 hypothetical protein NEMVEDRAFT_v1g222039 [Nematostella vectensis]